MTKLLSIKIEYSIVKHSDLQEGVIAVTCEDIPDDKDISARNTAPNALLQLLNSNKSDTNVILIKNMDGTLRLVNKACINFIDIIDAKFEEKKENE